MIQRLPYWKGAPGVAANRTCGNPEGFWGLICWFRPTVWTLREPTKMREKIVMNGGKTPSTAQEFSTKNLLFGAFPTALGTINLHHRWEPSNTARFLKSKRLWP